MSTAENLLNAAIEVLERRGRCRENFVLADGSVDPLGALAVAAGEEPDIWMGLRELPESQIVGADRVLVDAAWYLVVVAVPHVDSWQFTVDDMVSLLGDWADRASDAEVFAALAKAAHATRQVAALHASPAGSSQVVISRAAIECVLLDHADELDDEAGCVDANLADLAHEYRQLTGFDAKASWASGASQVGEDGEPHE